MVVVCFYLLQLRHFSFDFFNHSFADNKWLSIAVIYYEYGSLVLTYSTAEKAVRALLLLEEGVFDQKRLLVLLLPNIQVNGPMIDGMMVNG